MKNATTHTRAIPPCPPSGPARAVWLRFMAAVTTDAGSAQRCQDAADRVEARQAGELAPLPLFDRGEA